MRGTSACGNDGIGFGDDRGSSDTGFGDNCERVGGEDDSNDRGISSTTTSKTTTAATDGK